MAEFIYGYRYKNNGQQFNVTVARFIFQCVNVKTYPSEPDKALYKLCLFTLSVVGIALMPVLRLRLLLSVVVWRCVCCCVRCPCSLPLPYLHRQV